MGLVNYKLLWGRKRESSELAQESRPRKTSPLSTKKSKSSTSMNRSDTALSNYTTFPISFQKTDKFSGKNWSLKKLEAAEM